LQRPVEPAGAPAGAWANAAVELIRAAAVTAKNREIFIFVSCDKKTPRKCQGKNRRKPEAIMQQRVAMTSKYSLAIATLASGGRSCVD
jgi:hypothetical protein